MDDLKISCVDANEVTKMIQWLDYSIPGEVRISMEEYLRGVLDEFPEEITETP